MKRDNRSPEGMGLGMCFGMLIGCIVSPEYLGLCMSLGMLAGFAIGLLVER